MNAVRRWTTVIKLSRFSINHIKMILDRNDVGLISRTYLLTMAFFKHVIAALKPFKPSRCIKASFHIPENRLNFPTTKGFRMNISIKLFYQYMAIFFTFSPTSNHLHPLQVENCDSNSRLVVDEDDNVK